MTDKQTIWNEHLIKLKEKISKLSQEKEILLKSHGELSSDEIKPSNLQDKITSIDDWIEFYSKDARKYENKLKVLETKDSQDNAKEKTTQNFNFVFGYDGGSVKSEDISKKAGIFGPKKPLAYAAVFLALFLVIGMFFLLKPNIIGHVTFNGQATYKDNLGIKINDSGNYTWRINKSADIKSIMASGSVSANGTVRVYIEKDGKKYLIFDSKNIK